jgi:hypothetical protein
LLSNSDIIDHAKSGQCPIGRFNLSADELAKLYPPAPEPKGPGTELTKMYHQMGIDIGGCNCPLRASQMDAWGSACVEHLDEIVGWLTVAAKERGWFDVQDAGVKAFDLGLPMTIRGQVLEAIRRAEEKAKIVLSES